jgi:hypothetical protein
VLTSFWLWFAAVVCLFPTALYVAGRLRDPFHPFLFVGAATFFVACYRPASQLQLSLSFVSLSALGYYFAVTAFSLLAFYVGFVLYRRKQHENEPQPTPVDAEYSAGKMIALGTLYVAIGTATYLLTRENYEITGYLCDFAALWVPGFILVLQAMLLRRSLIPFGLLVLAAALIHPVDRIVIYGQRGDTFRLAVLTIPFFLFFARRPPRAIFLPLVLALGVVLAALPYTRGLVGEAGGMNRIQALAHVLRTGDFNNETTYSGGEEHVYGAAAIQAVRDSGKYNYGRFLADIAVRFLPKEFFDKEAYYSPWSRTNAFVTTGDNAGFTPPFGAYPTGFAMAFIEFWWFSLLFWAALGYSLRALYDRAVDSTRINFHGYYTCLFIILLYLITQDLADFVMNIIYILIPMYIGYRLSRLHVVQFAGVENGVMEEPSLAGS